MDGLEESRTVYSQRRAVLTGVAVLALVLISPWVSVRFFRTSPLALGFFLLLGTGVWVALRAWFRSRARSRRPFGLAVASEPPRAPSPDRQRLRGRVRAIRTLEAPLSFERCVAYRLVGTTYGGETDDCQGVSFDVEVEGEDRVVRVELGAATLDLRVEHAPTAAVMSPPLTRFLAQRGLFPERGPVVLAEGTLREGALVEVTGLSSEEKLADGYRATQDVTVLRDDPREPLRVRAL